MRVVDFDDLLTVAHITDGELVVATPDPVGIRLPSARERRRKVRTRCGLEVGPTWIDASASGAPDCPDCSPATAVEEPMLL